MPVSEPGYPDALPEQHRLHWYVIERVLGQGGFGITYLARDTNLDQRVAIKEYLPVDVASRRHDATVGSRTDGSRERYRWGLDRFIKEARMLARFDHPNIVRVHSVFELNNTAYMVMRFEAGENLAHFLETRGTLGEDELLKILLPVLDGLALVHAAGFIHRDIKPDNIHIRADGSPVLLDFGSARTAVGKAHTLTILVAPGYSPFEQYNSSSESQGPWTDIYGLGATCYRAIAGRAPLDAIARSKAILGAARDAIVPASVVGAGRYSGRLLAAIDHALAFSEKDRPQTIGEWRKELAGNGGTPLAAPRAAPRAETRVETRVPGLRTMTAPPVEGTQPVAALVLSDRWPDVPAPIMWLVAGAAGAAVVIGLLLHYSRNSDEPPKPPTTTEAEASRVMEGKITALEKQVEEQARQRAEEERQQRDEAERKQRQAAEAEGGARARRGREARGRGARARGGGQTGRGRREPARGGGPPRRGSPPRQGGGAQQARAAARARETAAPDRGAGARAVRRGGRTRELRRRGGAAEAARRAE